MSSNRASAQRSRQRKQDRLDELEVLVLTFCLTFSFCVSILVTFLLLFCNFLIFVLWNDSMRIVGKELLCDSNVGWAKTKAFGSLQFLDCTAATGECNDTAEVKLGDKVG